MFIFTHIKLDATKFKMKSTSWVEILSYKKMEQFYLIRFMEMISNEMRQRQ